MRQQSPRPFALLIATGLLLWGAWETRFLMRYSDIPYVPYIFAGLAALCALRFLTILPRILWKIIRRIFVIMRPSTRAGSARWATLNDLRKAGLLKRHGFFMGMMGGKAVWADIESSGLILAPAGGGKTVNFVIPALMTNPTNMVVLDMKSTLYHITARYREKKFGHKIVVIDFSGNLESACYNPMQRFIEDWRDPKLHPRLVPDVESLAKQLCPEKPNTNSDPFWGNGQRKFLNFALLYTTIMSVDPTLTNTLLLLSDMERFENALIMAASTTHLNGDLALQARDILTKIQKGGDPKQIDSFREGATQALQSFRPSGIAARITSRSDITAQDLRNGKVTLYIIGDPANSTSIAPVMACLTRDLMSGLIRTRGASVCFMCDEVTNFKIEGLPAMLTLAREYKIKLWLIVQELEEWARIYGRESLETLLSQTEVKLFPNCTSDKVCQLVSNMLGEKTVKSRSYNLGSSYFDEVTSSVSETSRPVMTKEEIRREKGTIAIIRKEYPILLDGVGYHEMEPLASKAGINPLFGTRYRADKIRLRL